ETPPAPARTRSSPAIVGATPANPARPGRRRTAPTSDSPGPGSFRPPGAFRQTIRSWIRGQAEQALGNGGDVGAAGQVHHTLQDGDDPEPFVQLVHAVLHRILKLELSPRRRHD